MCGGENEDQAFSALQLQPPSGDRHRAQRFDFHSGVQTDVQRVEDFDGSFKRDSEVFVAFIARHLGLVHVESPSQLSLRYPLSDTG